VKEQKLTAKNQKKVKQNRTFAEGFRAVAAEKDFKLELGNEVARRLRKDRAT
jgi:hypothetical protein